MPLLDDARPAARTEPGLQVFAPGWHDDSRFLVLRQPIDILREDHVASVPDLLRHASHLAESGRVVAGFVSYEAGPAFDEAFRMHSASSPVAWFGVYDADTVERVPRWRAGGQYEVLNPTFTLSKEAYSSAFERIQHAIHEGDVYQINFTAPLHFRLDGSPLDLWSALVRRQPVPYGAYVDTGDIQVVSCSPELFFDRRGDHVITRPMKGTVRRGATPEEDADHEEWLAQDAKSRAENLMIVDLLRNDLSRCSVPGSVRVPKLFTTERYSTVIQMTSEVEARLRPTTGTADLFESLFPCGSVTGAPKIEAVRLIHELEGVARGIYCGAVGFMHKDRAVFNVAIRTAVIRGGSGTLGIGSGIVSDSHADAEYDECLLKASFLTSLASARGHPPDTLRLIETMRADRGRIPLLDLHTNRLRTSAAELGFAFDATAWRRRVRDAIDGLHPQKVRSLLSSDGAIEVTSEDLASEKATWLTKVAESRISATDPYRRHKTTGRELYEVEWRKAVRDGYDEVIFLNERGEVAEGSRSNVVVRFGDELITPPVTSGALPGVYRQHLIDTQGLRERALTLNDFEKADEVYLCNAVRGMIQAQIALAPQKIREDVS